MGVLRQAVALVLNLPWTIIGLVAALISGPRRLRWSNQPWALIVEIRSFWWYDWMPSRRGVRAIALGNIGISGPKVLPHDLEHELIHIEQGIREPFIHPFLNSYQNWRYGYRRNKYEIEAYDRSDSVYLE